MARVLIVDDHKDFRDATRIFLERRGHEVLDTQDGAEAVQLCREHKPDLVILDVFMPGKDGIEILWQIRGEGLASRIIVVSAGKGAPWSSMRVEKLGALKVAKEFGADLVLGKPIEPEVLMNAVEDVLKK